MTSLRYNPESKKLLDTVALNLPHALLIDGPDGVGLLTIAREIAWRDLAGVIQSTDSKGAVDTSAKGVIRVTQIRELIQSTRGKLTERQIFVVDEADKMNQQAQNAFLKLLEEPNEHVSFILTSHAAHQLLPTVLSRVQRVHIKPLDTADTRSFITHLGVTDARKIEQLVFLADGLPAELTRLVKDEGRFAAQSTYVADARALIQGNPYQRAIVAHKYHGDRSAALDMLAVGQQIIRRTLKKNPTEALIETIERFADTYDRIAANGNIRLQLMNLVIQ